VKDISADTPLVSIIVPAYNSNGYLKDCMCSLCSQSYPNIEIVLIDDGSTDGTEDDCDYYANKYEFVKVIHQSNQGQAAARNKGLQAAEGNWICFVDSDDMIHPQMIKILMNMIIESNVRISGCAFNRVREMPDGFKDLQSVQYDYMDVNEGNLYNEKYETWCITARIIDKAIIEHNLFTPGKIYEDNAVVLYWLSEAGRIAVTNEELYYYRIHPESTTEKLFNTKKLDLLWALEQRLDFCIKSDYRRLLAQGLIFYIHNTMYMCEEVRKLGEKKQAKLVKKNTLYNVLKRIQHSTNKIGVLLRAVKLFIMY